MKFGKFIGHRLATKFENLHKSAREFCCSDLCTLVQKSGSELKSQSRLSGFLRKHASPTNVENLQGETPFDMLHSGNKSADAKGCSKPHGAPNTLHWLPLRTRWDPIGQDEVTRNVSIKGADAKVCKKLNRGPFLSPLALQTLRYHIGLFWVTWRVFFNGAGAIRFR